MPSNPLSLREREEIRSGIIRERSNVEIAECLGRHRCTVSAEISRNGGRDQYRAWRAHRRAAQKRKRPKVALFDRRPDLKAHVIGRLEAKDSPMTIAVELAQGVYPELAGDTVSHETIYQAIYNHHRPGGLPRELFRCLHRRRRIRVRRGTRRPQHHWRTTLRPISQRPAIADKRTQVGHLEGDLIIGKGQKSALITVFDRQSRYLWLGRLPNGRSARPTLRALTKLIHRIPAHLRRTLTWDQGGEMALYAKLEKRVGITVYFADPRSPWQRPTNENGNCLIRRYVGKRTDLSTFNNADLRAIETRINTMPRRIHNWTSAQTIYDQAVAMTT